MVGEVCEYDELAGNYEKLDTVRILVVRKSSIFEASKSGENGKKNFRTQLIKEE